MATNTTYPNWFFPYGKYSIVYKGVNLGIITEPIGFTVIPVEIPIVYANGVAGKATIDYNYVVDCEINEVFPSVIDLFFGGNGIKTGDKETTTMAFGQQNTSDYAGYVKNSGKLRIYNNDDYDITHGSIARRMYFYNAVPAVNSILPFGERNLSKIIVSFFCSRWKLEKGDQKGKRVTGGIGDGKVMFGSSVNDERG